MSTPVTGIIFASFLTPKRQKQIYLKPVAKRGIWFERVIISSNSFVSLTFWSILFMYFFRSRLSLEGKILEPDEKGFLGVHIPLVIEAK